MEMRTITAEDKKVLVGLHKMLSAIDNSGAAASALLQTLGKSLREGVMTPDDAADIIKDVFDEEADKGAEEVGEILRSDPLGGLAALLSLM